MNPTKLDWTWEEWQASRYRRRQEGKRVAPEIIRRSESRDDARLRDSFDGERGPAFPTDEELRKLAVEFSNMRSNQPVRRSGSA